MTSPASSTVGATTETVAAEQVDITSKPVQASAVAVQTTPQIEQCDPDMAGMDQDALAEYTGEPTAPLDAAHTDNDLMCQGFVPFYRVWRDTWFWKHKPWSYAQLFLFMFMEANGKPRKHEFEGKIINIPRGALYTSAVSLARQSGLDRKTVGRFLSKLEQAGEIKFLRKGRKGAVVSLCNFELYQVAVQMKGHKKHNRQGNHRTTTPQP